jgi:transcriptional regulator with XRE-family HTH domain
MLIVFVNSLFERNVEMRYHELLSQYIKNSGLTLRQISAECEKHGISMDSSYISRMQTGKVPPPSEEVSRTIATICNQDPQPLIMQGYIDKAPEPIQKLLNEYGEKWETLVLMVYQLFNHAHPQTLEEFGEKFNRLSTKEQIDLVSGFFEKALRVRIVPRDNQKPKYEYIRDKTLLEELSCDTKKEAEKDLEEVLLAKKILSLPDKDKEAVLRIVDSLSENNPNTIKKEAD